MTEILSSLLMTFAQLLAIWAFLISIFIVGFGVIQKLFPHEPWYFTLLTSAGVGLALLLTLLDVSVHFFGYHGYTIVFLLLLGAVIIAIYTKEALFQLLLQGLRSARAHKWLVFIFLITTLSMWLGIALSGTMTDQGVLFQPGVMRDSLWHLALIKSLLHSNPPIHPSDSALVLTNYHYFYDLFVAAWHQVSNVPIMTLYFKWAGLLTMVLLTFSSLVVVRTVVRQHLDLFGSILLIFLCWGGSLAFLIPVFLPGQVWSESSFWVSQTFVMLVNPQLLLSFAMLNVLIVLGLLGCKQHVSGKQFYSWLVVLFLTLYVTAGLKFFGVVFGFVIIAVFFAWYWLQSQRKIRTALFIGAFLCLSVSVITLRFVDLSAKQMVYAPLWFVTSMIASPDRVFIPDWTLREEHYRTVGSWHHLLGLKILETGIFYVGNLGLRVFGIVFFITLVIARRRREKLFHNRHILFLFFGLAAISSTIPLFFIQNGIVWNSIQFWYYTLFFMNFLVAIVVGYGVLLLKHRWVQGIVLILVLGLSSIMFGKHFVTQLTQYDYITPSELEITQNISKSELVLVCPIGRNSSLLFDSSFLSFFSDAKVMLIDPLMLEVIGKQGDLRTSTLVQDLRQSDTRRLVLSQPRSVPSVLLCDPEQLQNKANTIGTVMYKKNTMMLVRIHADCREPLQSQVF